MYAPFLFSCYTFRVANPFIAFPNRTALVSTLFFFLVSPSA